MIDLEVPTHDHDSYLHAHGGSRHIHRFDREREAVALLRQHIQGLPNAFGLGDVLRDGDYVERAAVLALFDAAPDAPGLDVERLGKAMWEAWPKHHEFWLGSPVTLSDLAPLNDDLRDRIAAEYARLSTSTEAEDIAADILQASTGGPDFTPAKWPDTSTEAEEGR